MPVEITNHWPSGARDTTEFPKVKVDIDVTFRDHLKAFTQMDGAGWTDYEAMNAASGSDMTGSRLRTYRKLYEKCGLIYRSDGKIHLSRLGQQMETLEADLEAKKEEVLAALRKTAIDILSRYQLRNPADNDPLPEDCDVLPAICMWKALRQLDNKLHAEEVNRVLLRVMRMADLDKAIAHIREIRNTNSGKYDSEESLASLGEPVHTNQAQARIAPWFSFLGWGGLIIEQGVDSDSYRNLTPESIPLIDDILSNPPVYFATEDELHWSAHYIGTDNATKTEDNESKFVEWLTTALKANGTQYSESTRQQYISALKAVATQFSGAIGPFTSVFEIADEESFERAVAAIKSDGTYEEFNRSRGNGSLSAGLDLYKRFLLERNDTSNMFSPEWFREKAAEYPTLDDEAEKLLADFQAKFNPEYLASLSGVEMLNTIFLNAANAENMCRALEFGPQIKDTFGSIKGGNAYKYGLYYSSQGAWMTGSHQKPRQLTEEEAIEVGAKLRDHLVSGANAIKEYGSLTTLEDYKNLHKVLHDVTEGDIERVWFLKYYQMLYPELFATNYSDYAQRTVLGAIGEEKEKYALVRMGQIRFYANKCGISNVMFNKIFWEYYSEEAVATKAEPSQDICYNTGYSSEFPRNRILFGAPGTGKSFTLNREKNLLLAGGGEYERVTFHPDYSYASFVGTYKPVPCKDSDGKDAITYSYVPGPFMRIYVKALQNSRTDAPKPFLLVIEEINRANVAAVFGDVFQLLDRGDDEVSEYPIQASEDIKKYLAGELGGNPDDYAEIRIPDNMFIWATMNSADQGVFPMDTAFKRRWDFTYLGIDDSEAGIVGKKVVLGQGDYRRVVEWNALRKAINNELLTYKVNEDKLMGPYFISKKNLPEGEMIDPAVFTRIFKNKVIMYLFDDAAKQKRITLFGGCDEKAKNQYSKICREFDTKGVYIFCEGISSQFIDNVPEDDGE